MHEFFSNAFFKCKYYMQKMDFEITPFDLNLNPKSIDLDTLLQDEIKVELAAAHKTKDGRIFKLGKWFLPKTLVLCHSKKLGFDKYGPTKTLLAQMTMAPKRWKALADNLWAKGVHHNEQQIQDNWKQLSIDYKKVYDYEKKIHIVNRVILQ